MEPAEALRDSSDLQSYIHRAESGDIDSYGLVVSRVQGRLRAFIASFCPGRDLVDEIAQQTFVWAYEHLAQYKPGTRFYSWLKSIARNILMAELEALKRRTRNRRNYLVYLQTASCRNRVRSESLFPERRLSLRKNTQRRLRSSLRRARRDTKRSLS